MFERSLIHRVDIYRPGHTTVNQSKTTTRTLLSSGVICLLQPVAVTETQTILGVGEESSYTGNFLPEVDIRHGDEIEWADRSLTLMVDTVQPINGRNEYEPRGLEVSMREKDA